MAFMSVSFKEVASRYLGQIEGKLKALDESSSILSAAQNRGGVHPQFLLAEGERHVRKHSEVFDFISDILKSSQLDELSLEEKKGFNSALKVLAESEDMLKELEKTAKKMTQIPGFLKNKERLHPDPYLLTCALASEGKPRKQMHAQWELNYSLLLDAFNKSDCDSTKRLIRFLMINYLAKAAYLNFDTGTPICEAARDSYLSFLQTGQLTMQGLYHRSNSKSTSIFLKLDQILGGGDERIDSMFCLDMADISSLYCLSFIPTRGLQDMEDTASLLASAYLSDSWNKPLLVDVTKELEGTLKTNGDQELIERFRQQRDNVKGQILNIVDLALAKIKEKGTIQELDEQIRDRLLSNLAIISYEEICSDVSALYVHSGILKEEVSKNGLQSYRTSISELKEKFSDLVEHTGIGLGAVKFREVIAEKTTDPSEIQGFGNCIAAKYLVCGSSLCTYFQDHTDILKTNAFKTLKEIGSKTPCAQQIFAKFTTEMMETLFSSISKDSWQTVQKDPIFLELTQNICYMIQQDISNAIFHQDDFRIFSQAVDRIHSQLSALLKIYAPFNFKVFIMRYKDFLQRIVPSEMSPLVGLAKSAMNVYAGINAAIYKKNIDPTRICAPHSYYEESALLPKATPSLREALDNPSIESIDLYTAEFNHNIDIDETHSHYKKGSVIEDIREIFDKKPKTDSLTVAIDATIDFVLSENIQLLLETFSQEIKDGRLNVVVFRSGQKFDMLGLDNYYGSPFYILNNGDEKWSHFESLFEEKVFQTDPLSRQYFTWLASTDLLLADQYKKLIFDNTREILDQVPPTLLPEKHGDISIGTFDKEVQTPFLEITIGGPNQDELRQFVQQRFIERFSLEGKNVYVRGSFGFPHPNITWIEPKMRINPGIDSSEISLYKDFFNDLEAKVQKKSEE